MSAGTVLFLLLAGHALCDYPLQGDFLARAKDHTDPVPGVPWYQCLTAHALIHALAVFVITGSLWYAFIEFGFHWSIDFMKNDGAFEFNTDQALHILTKVTIWVLWVTCGTV